MENKSSVQILVSNHEGRTPRNNHNKGVRKKTQVFFINMEGVAKYPLHVATTWDYFLLWPLPVYFQDKSVPLQEYGTRWEDMMWEREKDLEYQKSTPVEFSKYATVRMIFETVFRLQICSLLKWSVLFFWNCKSGLFLKQGVLNQDK